MDAGAGAERAVDAAEMRILWITARGDAIAPTAAVRKHGRAAIRGMR